MALVRDGNNLLREELVNSLAHDCVHFKGDRPCRPHLRDGVRCRCSAYTPRSAKILLIQLSSPLTVIRSSALVYRLKNDDPDSHITYLTFWPELLPREVGEPLAPDAAGILRLQMDQFDEAYNLGVDRRSCATMNIIDARQKMGYYLRQGDPVPLDGAAAEYLKAIAPYACGPDQPGTLQSLFQMCSLEYRRELPRLFAPASDCPQPMCQGPLIGLNTSDDSESSANGCWNHRHWLRLIEMLTQCGMTPLLLGNPGTDMLNRWLANNSPAVYPGPVTFGHTELSGKSNLCYYDTKEIISLNNHEGEESLSLNDFVKGSVPLNIRDFMALLGRCDVIAGTAGLTIELAWSLGREVAILRSGEPHNNIKDGIKAFTDSEVPDYFRSRHTIIEPLGVPQGKAGLNDILPDQVFQAILERLQHSTADKTTRSDVSPNRKFTPDSLATERARVSNTRRRPY
ncbi:MAG: hypothetical protein KAJ46_03905 [Sedimentisphaerales bacterium]|nr:hypothetical protein [Sedimentisphaerales bacterium]